MSYSKVRAISRVTGTDTATLTQIGAAIAAGDPHWRHNRVADPEAAERVLLNVALCGTASHIETVVAAVRRLRTPPRDTAARRAVAWRTDDDGSLLVRARLTPDAGAAFIAALKALVPPTTPPRYSDGPSPEDLDERAREQEPGPAVDRLAARRADALLALVTGTTSGTGAASGATGTDTAADRGPALATPAQITALVARAGERCQFPGCTHTHYLQAHHVRHWLHGGPTDIDNLVLICSFHHAAIHDHGYRIRRLPGRWEFLRPDGSPIPEPVVLSGNAESLIEMHTWDRLRIDRKTLSPQWYGEQLDVHPILDALLPRRIPAAA